MRNSQKPIDTFKLSQQEMKVKAAKHSSRRKEDAAFNQAFFIARTGRGDNTTTIKNILEETKLNKKVQAKDPIRFSGKFAHSFTFGNQENVREQILLELNNPNTTKTRAKKLRAQLREIESKIELANSLK